MLKWFLISLTKCHGLNHLTNGTTSIALFLPMIKTHFYGAIKTPLKWERITLLRKAPAFQMAHQLNGAYTISTTL